MSDCQRDANGNFVAHYGPFELRTAYQPIFRLHRRGAGIHGFEALIRVHTAAGKKLPPDRFFPLVRAEDRFLVENLCRELHLRNMRRFSELPPVLFANFDPSVYADRATTDREIDRMERMADEVGIGPNRIVCEITEKRARSAGSLSFLVDRLRGAGYAIALDDYGADDSDAERIDTIRPDIVKFDAMWIRRLLETPAGYNLLATMVGQFRSRGIETLFEGLEERWQLELAETMGVEMAQGFILARPELAPAHFADLFATPDDEAFKLSDAPLPDLGADPLPQVFDNEDRYSGDVLSQFKHQAFGRRFG